MTNKEMTALNEIANRIDHLASMENCSLSEESKKEFKLYMSWFNCCANYIREIIDLSTQKGYHKSDRLSEIIRLNSY